MLLPGFAWAQIQQYPLERKNQKTSTSSARIQAEVSLPFWDDFSLTTGHPSNDLWFKNNTVSVNNGQAFEAPTINVATFDGLDANGVAYSSGILDNGYRDTLESQPIKMTEVLLAEQNSVFLSFYYQAGGKIDPANQSDFLRLEFKSTEGWKSVDTFRTKNLDPTVFYHTIYRINQAIYFHDDFRFRFVSFGRNSGLYDGWHIDYVYLDKGRTQTQHDYPDRSFYTNLSGIFGMYNSVPVKHFFSSTPIVAPYIGVSNLENYLPGQPTDYAFDVTVKSFNNNALLDEQTVSFASGVSPDLSPFEKRIIQLSNNPPNSAFDPDADSITLKYFMNYVGSGDEIEPTYSNIDFRVNDTISFHYSISDYYAYDDGRAEFSAGLQQPGEEFALMFVVDPGQDSIINGVDIYFPSFTDKNPESVEIFVTDTLIDNASTTLYEQTMEINANPYNEFTRVTFYEGIVVRDTFYIGYREPSTDPATMRVRVGLDKDNDSESRAFFRTSAFAEWQPSDRVPGSFMIRPRFGPATVNGLPEKPARLALYPNPSRGSFYLKGQAEQLHITTITGEPVYFSTEDLGEEKRIEVSAPTTGMYIIRYRSGSKIVTDKILIQQ